MRIEKGHVAGPELNGTTTAGDLGLGKMMSTKKDFVGRVMAGREALVAPDRQVVVGVKPRTRHGACAPARTSSRRAKRPARTPTRATSPRSASRRRSINGSGSGWSSAAASASAKSSRAHDPLRGEDYRGRALQSRLLRSGWRASAWLSFPGSHAQPAGARACPGRTWCSRLEAGVSLTEIRNFALIQVMARRGRCGRSAQKPPGRILALPRPTDPRRFRPGAPR